MADDTPIQDPYQFYNNRYLKRSDISLPGVHSYTSKQTADKPPRENRKIKLFPLLRVGSSRKSYVASGKELNCSKTENEIRNNGYLPAQLSVEDLLPGKQNDKKQLSSQEDVVIVTACDSSVLGEIKVDLAAQSNPYNKINQNFHTALWCPCCIFLFFLFCIPAVMFMRQSDVAYAEQDFKLAKKHGRTSTALYFVGVLTGICFYAFVIFVAIYFIN